MALTKRQVKALLEPSWKKSFLVIAYFILLGLLSLLPTSAPFYVLSWPYYLLPSTSLLAAVLELAFAYVVASIVQAFLERRHS
ncbi:hypothetical protein KY327_00045 [Candidatus Woesearchaeota archaeon]|nr:hypothetical protein [Candidatus Woesearchaeota archaeon]